MPDLTQRQRQILKHLVEEYMSTAEPVGSGTLEKKYSIGASPATLRNEMVKLTQLGFLKKPHTSAGRAPTPMGLRLYVHELMKEQELSVAEEVAVKEKIWDYRNEFEKLLREATRNLASRTKNLALSATRDGALVAAGTCHILEMPEFYDIDVTRNLLSLLDRSEYFTKLIEKFVGDEDIHVLVGDDLGSDVSGSYGFVFRRFHGQEDQEGVIGVLGPARLNYPYIIPTVRYFSDLIDELSEDLVKHS
jgi:heat-inducible transcriptional repressor